MLYKYTKRNKWITKKHFGKSDGPWLGSPYIGYRSITGN